MRQKGVIVRELAAGFAMLACISMVIAGMVSSCRSIPPTNKTITQQAGAVIGATAQTVIDFAQCSEQRSGETARWLAADPDKGADIVRQVRPGPVMVDIMCGLLALSNRMSQDSPTGDGRPKVARQAHDILYTLCGGRRCVNVEWRCTQKAIGRAIAPGETMCP